MVTTTNEPRTSERPEEDTPLFVILPSANSTEKPSLSNLKEYGASFQASLLDEERSTTSLEVYSPLKHGADANGVTLTWRTVVTRCRKLLPILILLVAAVVVAIVVATETSSKPAVPPTTKLGNPNDYMPLSKLSPVKDLKVPPIGRPFTSDPSKIIVRKDNDALPTNVWYQNLLMTDGEPDDAQNVYTLPYLIDLVGFIPGLFINPQHVGGNNRNVNLISDPGQGITLGIANDVANPSKWSVLSRAYTVQEMTPIAVTLKWNVFPMTSTIVMGTPYGTLHFPMTGGKFGDDSLLPSIASQVPLRGDITVDNSASFACGTKTPTSVTVQREITMVFAKSDFTWVAFFSEPVVLQCVQSPDFGKVSTVLQVQNAVSGASDMLTVRMALVTSCTTGTNPIFCADPINKTEVAGMAEVLRQHADIYPGPKADIKIHVDNVQNKGMLTLDWDPQSSNPSSSSWLRASSSSDKTNPETELILFAMPHHMESFGTSPADYAHCAKTLFGDCCIIKGPAWELPQNLPDVSFWASVPPAPSAFPDLANSLKSDMSYTLPSYYLEGAGDTYFSGKMLAKLARILLIAQQLKDVCAKAPSDETLSEYATVCEEVVFPTEASMTAGIARLRAAVEVWINGTAITPFVYDAAWGGIVSCGCFFDQEIQSCSNRYPDCPSLSNPGLDFGNGFYNDHHFHYGYFIYSSAAVAHFDPAWGRKYFEQVLLLVRDIGNPAPSDPFFPLARHKDWFSGHSWAGGIPPPPFVMGRNQESSSEAIAAYEGVALFGQAMVPAWEEVDAAVNATTAEEIRDFGKMLLATELQSVKEYWHVRTDGNIYPSFYSENVVGILWSVMTEFQTWFGAAPYLPYGIQLLPLTAISQNRDSPGWAREMYPPFADACNADPGCQSNGWSILVIAILAEVGHVKNATAKALDLPPKVFLSAGGNGHSLTNTLWYISTRPKVEPLELKPPPAVPDGPPGSAGTPGAAGPPGAAGTPGAVKPPPQKHVKDCSLPKTCTAAVLDTMADGFTCRSRMDWLMNYKGDSEDQACATVGSVEFPKECGNCATPMPPRSEPDHEGFDCGLPGSCTAEVLNNDASGFTCENRIKWLIDTKGDSLEKACYTVGKLEFPTECGKCSPSKPGGAAASTTAATTTTASATTTSNIPSVFDCGIPKTCTGKVLNTLAAGYTCLARITWLMKVQGKSEEVACEEVAGTQYPTECGGCKPVG